MLTVTCRNISYPQGKIVIDSAQFSLEPGKTLGIMGPSGSGKSTLLRLIANLESDIAGEIKIEGASKVAMLFQDYDCYPWMSVWENVLFASRLGARDEASLIAFLEKFGLHASKHAWPWQLSGGMRKRLGLLRALVTRSDVILLDEPFSSLDFNTKIQVSETLLQTMKVEGRTVILISHDIDDIVMLADEALISTRLPLLLGDRIVRKAVFSNSNSVQERLSDSEFRQGLISAASRVSR